MSLGGEEPGWRAAWKRVPYNALLPMPGRLARQQGSNPLLMSRVLICTFAASTVAIGIVVLVLNAFAEIGAETSITDLQAAGAVCAFAVVTTLSARWVRPRLDCTSPASLAGSYTARLFLRIAFPESVASLGFVGFILTSNPWMYALGAAFALVNYWRIAPTERHLEADQQRLAETGCGLSLLDVLSTPHEKGQSGRM